MPASGHFCRQCGFQLASSQAEVVISGDWRQEVRYEALLRLDEVRDFIATHVAQARQGLTAEQFVELCDKAFAPLVSVPPSVVAGLALPLSERLGFRTGKSRQASSLARRANPSWLRCVRLADMGRRSRQSNRLMMAVRSSRTFPRTLRSMTGGELRVSLQRQKQGTVVEAVTNIPGQLYDWGKSTQVLTQLFDDLLPLPIVEATIVREVA